MSFIRDTPNGAEKEQQCRCISRIRVGDAYEGPGDPITKHLGRNRKSWMYFGGLLFWNYCFTVFSLVYCAPADHHGSSPLGDHYRRVQHAADCSTGYIYQRHQQPSPDCLNGSLVRSGRWDHSCHTHCRRVSEGIARRSLSKIIFCFRAWDVIFLLFLLSAYRASRRNMRDQGSHWLDIPFLLFFSHLIH